MGIAPKQSSLKLILHVIPIIYRGKRGRYDIKKKEGERTAKALSLVLLRSWALGVVRTLMPAVGAELVVARVHAFLLGY